MKEYYCGVADCIKGKRKICVHMTVKCANYGESHTTNFPWCISKLKADLETRKRKKEIHQKGKQKTPIENASKEKNINTEETLEAEREDKEESLLVDLGMELEYKEWAHYTEAENPEFFVNKSQNHNKTLRY